MILSIYLNYIVCYKGLYRSRLFVNALADFSGKHPPGIPAQLFRGGMERMRTLAIEKLQAELHPQGLITLIHDHSDNLEVFTAWQECQNLLERAKRKYQSVDMDQVYIFLRNLKIDPDEFKLS